MRVTRDWLEQARNPGEDVAACLRAAETCVRFPSDWNDIADRWLDHGEPGEARRCLDEALGASAGDISTCRSAASLLVRLGDRAAGGAALRLAEEALGDGLTSRWVWVAQAHHELLGDAEGAARCLAEAARRTKSGEDLTALAEGHLTVGDLAKARELLGRAEEAARARGEHRALWGVANLWRGEVLRDQERARATLAAGTAETTDVRTLTAFSVAWRSLFGDEEGIRSALARAETLAATAQDWIEVAVAYLDGGVDARADAWDPAGGRRCLEAAVAAQPSGPERNEIARAFRQRLGDPARADAIAPVGVIPEETLPRRHRLEGWPDGAPGALLRALRGRLDDAALESIAVADYGFSWIKHHQALVEIVRTGLVPLPLDWYPAEVLELTRWQRGSKTHHVARAFSALLLCIDHAAPGNRRVGEIQDSLAPLLESCWLLGLDGELEDFLVWLAEVQDPEDRPAWSLLAVILARAHAAPRDPRLPALVALLERTVDAMSTWRDDHRWLWGSTNFQQSYDQWQALLREVLGPDRDPAPELLRLAERLQV